MPSFQRCLAKFKFLGLYLVVLCPLLWIFNQTSCPRCEQEDLNGDFVARLDTRVVPYLGSTNREQVTNESRKFFKGSLMWGKIRKEKVFLTIGIPCIARPRNDHYILKTLNSLIKHSREDEKTDIVLAIFLADFDESSRKEIGEMLRNKYKQYIESGFIQIFQAPKNFYPPMENLQITLGDPMIKIKWRSKQNFDYAYNMLYSQNLSSYYLQLEDDVITVPNYFRIIKDFISKQKNSNWVCLEFSSLGFIAKLYHSYDVEKLARLLMLFYNDQPNDVTYLYFNTLLAQKNRIIREPTIFDHKGVHSSLVLKENSLRDPLFVGVPDDDLDNLDDSDANKNKSEGRRLPPAKASATFGMYESYTAESFYLGKSSVYWGKTGHKGDSFTVVFDTPQHISSITMTTGHKYYPEDLVRHGELRLGRTGDASGTKFSCSNIARTEALKDGHVTIGHISKDLTLACVQLLVTESQRNWVMVSNLTISVHPT